MSSDDEFEQFLQSADALDSPTADDALRVKARLSSRISWRNEVPASISRALRTPPAANAVPRFGLRSRFIKLTTIAISVAALSATTYSMVASRARTAGLATAPNGAPSANPASAAPAKDLGDVSPPATNKTPERTSDPIPILTMDDPARLPSVSSAPLLVKSARRPGTLDAEVALLAETNAALQSKEPARALALVDQHAREFPRGVLGPEFDAQHARALSALGRDGEACAVAARFLAVHPNSALAPQVRSSCNEFDR